MAEPVRLYELLPARLDLTAGSIRERLCQDEQISGLKLAWVAVADRLHQALKSALDCPAVEVLAECWANAGPVADLVRSAACPSGKPCTIELGKHELSHALNPVVEVTIGSCPAIALKFRLVVSAHIVGAQLSIINGYIASCKLGESWASAQLSYEDIPLHKSSQSRKLAIGGDFELTAPGIAIPGHARP